MSAERPRWTPVRNRTYRRRWLTAAIAIYGINVALMLLWPAGYEFFRSWILAGSVACLAAWGALGSYAQARQDAATQAEAAMRRESDRLAAPGDLRSVDQGLGVAKAMPAVNRAIRGEEPTDG